MKTKDKSATCAVFCGQKCETLYTFKYFKAQEQRISIGHKTVECKQIISAMKYKP